MWNLFGPRCPLETRDKLWTESRMRWLARTIGFDRLLGAEVILPEPRFFPDAYAGTPDDARRIFDRVCGFMGLDPARFDLDVVPDASIPNAAGCYIPGQWPRILLAESQLSDPERLVATIAHELAHDILLGGGLIADGAEDHEPLTDLVPVFLGLGLFTANATVRDRSHTEMRMSYFQISRQGYLPSHFVAYALALFAHARREDKPAWARSLRPDAARPLKQGLAYLKKTGDTLFGPGIEFGPTTPPTESEMLDRLAHGSPTVRAKTIDDLLSLESAPAGLGPAVARCLRDRDPHVQTLAAWLVPRFAERPDAIVPDLIWCLSSESDAVRNAAVEALAAVGAPDRLVMPELISLLKTCDPDKVDTAAAGLCLFAPSAATAIPDLVEILRKSFINGHPTDHLADAIAAIDPSPLVLLPLLRALDPETCREVTTSIRVARLKRGQGLIPWHES